MLAIRRLEMHVAHACNLSCESCSHYSNHRHKGLVSLADAEAWLAAWKSRVTPERFTLLGGEPTLHPDLTEFVRLARRTWPEAEIRLVTNGWFLHRHPELPAVLAADPDFSLLISVHHDSPEYREKLAPIFELTGAWTRDFGIDVQVERSFERWTRRYQGSGIDMKPYEDNAPEKSWANCAARHTPQLHEGKLWKCAPLAYLGMQHRKIGLTAAWAPYLRYEALPPECSDEELVEFLGRKAESYCGMCPANPERLELPVPFTTSGPARPGKEADSAVMRNLRPRLGLQAQPLQAPLRDPGGRPFRSFPIMHGSTGMVADFECHASVLLPGKSPHPPHAHAEEEILMILDGTAELILRAPGKEVRYGHLAAEPGCMVFYPPFSEHTIVNAGSTPLSYLMFRWRSGDRGEKGAMGRVFLEYPARTRDIAPDPTRWIRKRQILETPTRYLEKLHCHSTYLMPGGGYAAHSDAHDIAIVVLEGVIESAGLRVEPHGVLYIPAGTSHGMVNPGSQPALYLVFEFQGDGAGLLNDAVPAPGIANSTAVSSNLEHSGA